MRGLPSSRITVWCSVGQHNVEIGSLALQALTMRHGCDGCRAKEFARENERLPALQGMQTLVSKPVVGVAVVEIGGPGGPQVEFECLEPVAVGQEVVVELVTEDKMGRKKTSGAGGIQPDLPGTEGPRPKIPPALKKLDVPLCEAFQASGEAKQRENNLREAALQMMEQHGIHIFHLSNQGVLEIKPGVDKLVYKPPKNTTLRDEDGEPEGVFDNGE